MAMIRALAIVLSLAATPALAEEPLRIEITEGVSEPLAIALPAFADEGGAGARAAEIRGVIAADLTGSGLFHEIPLAAQIARPEGIDTPLAREDWRALNADAVALGSVAVRGGKVFVKFRLFDVAAGQMLGEGLQFDVSEADWRRAAHKVADRIMARLTGEGPAFDSRIAYVAETGAPPNRIKRLALIDADGAGTAYLTDGTALTLAPRWQGGEALIHTRFRQGLPQVARLDLGSLGAVPLPAEAGAMSFAASPSPDGRWLAVTRATGGNTDLWLLDAATGAGRPLTSGPEIDAAPSFSPDGTRLVFESDRSGSPQLYVMTLDGGATRRLTLTEGRHGAPAWSPTGDLIAFVASDGGRASARIGVIRADGTAPPRLLTEGHLDGAPSWSPNGRRIVFARRDAEGAPSRLAVVDAYTGAVQEIATETAASDPAWGPVLP